MATPLSGQRNGSTWFGSISLTSEMQRGNIKFAPYARIDAMMARLGQYSETGDPLGALTFQATNISSTAGVVGLRGSVDIKNGGDTYTPNMRVEYKHALDGGFTQSMFYNLTGAGGVYALDTPDTTRDIFTGAIGMRAHFGNAATIEVEYSLSGTPSRTSPGRARRFAPWRTGISTRISGQREKLAIVLIDCSARSSTPRQQIGPNFALGWGRGVSAGVDNRSFGCSGWFQIGFEIGFRILAR